MRVLEKAGFVHQGDVSHDEVGKASRHRLDRTQHPCSTAGGVAKALDTVTGKRLEQMAESG